jgi:peptide-methionine (R)-S-oxide reductase
MPTRRQVLFAAAATVGLSPLVAWLSSPSRVNAELNDASRSAFPVSKADDEWRRQLTSEQYYVLRERGTERAFTSALDEEKRHGVYTCAACGQELFSSEAKFESGTGWPSFFEPLDNAVGTSVDRSYFMVRTEVHCSRCGSHLGHVFDDGPRPTGLRYCMNGIAMQFRET